jgi:hypothetical protein
MRSTAVRAAAGGVLDWIGRAMIGITADYTPTETPNGVKNVAIWGQIGPKLLQLSFEWRSLFATTVHPARTWDFRGRLRKPSAGPARTCGPFPRVPGKCLGATHCRKGASASANEIDRDNSSYKRYDSSRRASKSRPGVCSRRLSGIGKPRCLQGEGDLAALVHLLMAPIGA